VDEAKKIIREGRKNIERTPSKTQMRNFHISQADIARYGATKGFYGCQFAAGTLSYQRGHATECRKRIMKMMREDPEDRHRVLAWEVNKGVGHHDLEDEDEVGAQREFPGKPEAQEKHRKHRKPQQNEGRDSSKSQPENEKKDKMR
jgi:hypothetical protein